MAVQEGEVSTAITRKPRKREAVIAAARLVFAERGYGASMEEIALEADVSKQTLYNLFGSKEQLFRDMVDDKITTIMEPLINATPQSDPRDVLMAIGRLYHTKIISPANVKMMRALFAAPNAMLILREMYDQGPGRFTRVFAEWLAKLHDAGRLNIPDPQLAAQHFVSFTFGNMYMQRLFNVEIPLDEADIERRVSYCVDAFLKTHAR
jgi:AcrR family transcriptional regulator